MAGQRTGIRAGRLFYGAHALRRAARQIGRACIFYCNIGVCRAELLQCCRIGVGVVREREQQALATVGLELKAPFLHNGDISANAMNG